MSLIWVGAMYKEIFGAIPETKNKKELQQNIYDVHNFHLYGGSCCDSASSRTLYEILTLYDLLTIPYL